MPGGMRTAEVTAGPAHSGAESRARGAPGSARGRSRAERRPRPRPVPRAEWRSLARPHAEEGAPLLCRQRRRGAPLKRHFSERERRPRRAEGPRRLRDRSEAAQGERPAEALPAKRQIRRPRRSPAATPPEQSRKRPPHPSAAGKTPTRPPGRGAVRASAEEAPPHPPAPNPPRIPGSVIGRGSRSSASSDSGSTPRSRATSRAVFPSAYACFAIDAAVS